MMLWISYLFPVFACFWSRETPLQEHLSHSKEATLTPVRRSPHIPNDFAPANITVNSWATHLHVTNPCTSDLFGVTTQTVTTVYGLDHTDISTTIAEVGLNAYGVSIRWQSTDFQPPITTSSSLPTTSTSITPTHSPLPKKSSLGTGGTAGVAVGAVLVALFALSAAWFFFRRKRANAQSTSKAGVNDNELQNPGFGIGKSELAATESLSMLPREVGGEEVVEAPEGGVVKVTGEARERPVHELA
jgi:hypothetical protein